MRRSNVVFQKPARSVVALKMIMDAASPVLDQEMPAENSGSFKPSSGCQQLGVPILNCSVKQMRAMFFLWGLDKYNFELSIAAKDLSCVNLSIAMVE